MLDLCPQTLVWRAVAGQGFCGGRRCNCVKLRVEWFTAPQARAVHFHASHCTNISVGLPSHLVWWKLEGRGHPVPPGGSGLRLQKNELVCAQLDHAKIRGDVEWTCV